jgi:hypothetical protein
MPPSRLELCHARHTFGQVHPFPQLLERLGGGKTQYLSAIRFGDAVPRMRQLIGQLTVVRNKNQPFAVPIESPHREHPSLFRHQVDHAHAAGRISIGRNDSHRFMDQEIHMLRSRQHLPVHANLLRLGIDLQSQLGDDLPINFHPPLQDPLLAFATTGHPGGS